MSVLNQRDKVHHVVSWVALLSAFSHVFCCGLPTLVGILSLLTSFGTFSTLLPGFNALHNLLSQYEMALIVFSVAVLMVGWGVQLHADHVDCHDSGCCHPPCDPKKISARRLLWLATVVFILNTGLAVAFHRHDSTAPNTMMVVTERP